LVTTGTSVAGLEPVEQAGEPGAPGGGDAAGDGLGDDAARLDPKAGGLDLAELVVGGLASGGDAEVGEGARHGTGGGFRPEWVPGR
jgi:hypothetical protein